MKTWDSENRTLRLWGRDSSLWTNNGESSFMGWLDVLQSSLSGTEALKQFADEIRAEGIRHVILLGMGGSVLCARVLRETFGNIPGCPELFVLDSTDPTQIAHCNVDLSKALCVVASKSGSTLETRLLYQYFRSRMTNFVAITDPGSPFEKTALDNGFRKIFAGVPSIGGRFSALSNFGLVPAALMGVDVDKLLAQADQMFHACGPTFSASGNPGVALGLFMGEHAKAGRDKLTLLTSPKLKSFGMWVEQLIAESSGKNGTGIVPVVQEPLAQNYANDRAFVYFRLDSDDNTELDTFVSSLAPSGHPLYRIDCADPYALGAEFFRWEFATAVAGSVLGINPFDQPDVEATKIATRELTSGAQSQAEPKLLSLADLLASINEGDYFSICAFIEMNEIHDAILRDIREMVLKRKNIATTHGFGPCFLHSTGQLHKGGPNTGVFLQITSDDPSDIEIPDEGMSFSFVKQAQAAADLSVLTERGRRCAHYHINGDVKQGLLALKAEIVQKTT